MTRIDAWIDAHFDDEVRFLQALVRVPTDTPPGDNAPHAETTATLLESFGFAVERHPVPDDLVRAHGLASITNLVVRRRYGDGPTIALNAHGDVVPPGEGWHRDPYGGEVDGGRIYGRAAAVSKSDFATYTFALRALDVLAADPALESLGARLAGGVELHFTYDEEFGGELGPGRLLAQGVVKPDLLIAAGFSYQVVTAHNGCLQLEVTVHGKMAHAAIPATGVDALQGAVEILNALYAQNDLYRGVTSQVAGITHPYLNVGTIAGGTNTKLVLGLEEPTGGTIRFEGRDLQDLDAAGRRHYRKSVQAVFQDPFASLSPRMRVSAIIAEPLVTNEQLTTGAGAQASVAITRSGRTARTLR